MNVPASITITPVRVADLGLQRLQRLHEVARMPRLALLLDHAAHERVHAPDLVADDDREHRPRGGDQRERQGDAAAESQARLATSAERAAGGVVGDRGHRSKSLVEREVDC